MKYYLKVFFISFVCFTLLIGGGGFTISKFKLLGQGDKNQTAVTDESNVVGEYNVSPSEVLSEKIRNGDRVNILVFGTDGGRSDTMMVFSYDSKNKLADVISIPRDTYNHLEGKNKAEQRKLNAVYGFKGEDGGPEVLKREISKILGIPIIYYIELDYKAVSKIVDTVGGIEVDIPYKMDYDDPYSKPPLHIHFDVGLQKLNGQRALEYLRWRGNNDGSYSNGDIDRVKRQQEFVVLATKKALGIRLPFVIKDIFSYLKTDMNIADMLFLGTQCLGFDFDNFQKHTLPGEPGIKFKSSYFFYNPDKTLALIKEIYERTPKL